MTGSQGRKQPTPSAAPVVIGNVTVYPITCPIKQAKFVAGLVEWCDRVEARLKREEEEAANAAD